MLNIDYADCRSDKYIPHAVVTSVIIPNAVAPFPKASSTSKLINLADEIICHRHIQIRPAAAAAAGLWDFDPFPWLHSSLKYILRYPRCFGFITLVLH
jgi:hypothetical protein